MVYLYNKEAYNHLKSGLENKFEFDIDDIHEAVEETHEIIDSIINNIPNQDGYPDLLLMDDVGINILNEIEKKV